MKPQDLVLRCYAECEGDQWQAICLDLNLAAQGNSVEEVKIKLNAQIVDYLYDCLVGEDKEYIESFLPRRAPLKYFFKYFSFTLKKKINNHICAIRFSLPLPLIPAQSA